MIGVTILLVWILRPDSGENGGTTIVTNGGENVETTIVTNETCITQDETTINRDETSIIRGETTILSGFSPGSQVSNDGTLKVGVPSDWFDCSQGMWAEEGLLQGRELGPYVFASPDEDSYYESNGSGVFFGASSVLADAYPENTANRILDSGTWDQSGSCKKVRRLEYEDEIYVGKQDQWTNCNNTDAEVFNIVALPEDRSFVVFVQIQVGSNDDRDVIYETITATFEVVGEL